MINDALKARPIPEEWTTPERTATAAELVTALAEHDPASLDLCHADLAAAVTELRRGGKDPQATWTVGDPIVALVRAAALSARRHPNASSRSAARVIEHLAVTAPSGNCGVPSGPS